jgi:hypothetical protein
MDKSTLKSAMLSAISEELDLWIDKESSITDGYQYESEFIKTTRKINHILLSKSLGEVSVNASTWLSNRRNKKNFIPVLGRFM